MKICTKCKSEKDDSEFYNKSRQCKLCFKEYYKKDKPRKKIERTIEIKEKYYNSYRKYRLSHRERCLCNSVKVRCKLQGIPFNLEESDIVIPEVCPLLGVKIEKEKMQRHNPYGPSIDRIDPTKGYIKGNIAIISYKANLMKNNATKEELLSFGSNISKYLGNDKK